MKLNVKFSHIERSEQKDAPGAEEKSTEIDKSASETPPSPSKESSEKKESQKTQPEKKPVDQTTRLSLDDLKKQHHRSSGVWIAAFVLVVLIVSGAGGYFLYQRQKGGSAATSTDINYADFSVNAFLDNPASLAGNRYKAQMRVESQLGYTPETGRLLVFKEQVNQKPLAVVVPAKLDKVNVEKGQLLEVKFIVKEGGVIYVEDIQKP